MPNLFTKVEMPAIRSEILHSDKIMLMGSCFADNIGERLASAKFNCLANPFGTLYNPSSIAQALRQTAAGRIYREGDEELFCGHDGMWHSWMHHSRFSSATLPDCISTINSSISKASVQLKNIDKLIITFGSSWIYRLKQNGSVVANCHKQNEKLFLRERLTPEAIVSEWNKLVADLKAMSPKLEIIFTVSPIRHRKDGFHANQLSKAGLLLAVDAICSSHPSFCHYFPAYEIMMDELRDYRFYADDMLHPSALAVDYIWELFSGCFFSTATVKLADECRAIQTALAHRPFAPESEAYAKFIENTKNKIIKLTEKHPYINMDEELSLCNTRLNK